MRVIKCNVQHPRGDGKCIQNFVQEIRVENNRFSDIRTCLDVRKCNGFNFLKTPPNGGLF
jgi:hypothetical protein